MLMDSRICLHNVEGRKTCFYRESNSYMSVVEAFAYKLRNSNYYYYYYYCCCLLSQAFSPWYFS